MDSRDWGDPMYRHGWDEGWEDGWRRGLDAGEALCWPILEVNWPVAVVLVTLLLVVGGVIGAAIMARHR